MSESITLHPRQHDKLGTLHIGVTRDGFISVAGEVHNIDDGEELQIQRVPVHVKRSGDEYLFSKVS